MASAAGFHEIGPARLDEDGFVKGRKEGMSVHGPVGGFLPFGNGRRQALTPLRPAPYSVPAPGASKSAGVVDGFVSEAVPFHTVSIGEIKQWPARTSSPTIAAPVPF
ncbi:uncharacterized protein CCOS01_09274 [Colletotrichum costaricense]|uniref:Uncharacterized protein n=1 Tax=Colletotrichum costaricense TaxID=1209916 RepID=A0AAJ0DYZ8_9PEZI|nr:uncharacterized protein CCOS01_09274 [Colletotrichum costaricense]KAK1524187.1 hypothetical protein CCOS01_09274 [Colletotrichum costaricense]